MVAGVNNFFEEFARSFFSLGKNKFVDLLISGDTNAAEKKALEMFKSFPQYLVIACYLGFQRSRLLLWRLLDRSIKDPDPVFLMLLADDDRLSTEERTQVFGFIKREISRHCQAQNDDRKQSFLTLSMRVKYLIGSGERFSAEELNELLDKIDDGRIYEYARKANLEIAERDSSNYRWHKAHLGDQAAAISLILKSTSFDDILLLSNTCSIKTTGSRVHDILIDFLTSSSENGSERQASALSVLIEEIIGSRSKGLSFMELKVLLALLISTREPKNLMLSLYLASEFTGFAENYEISLIYLFICRYFCLIPEICRILKAMDVKNIQLYNMAYVWNDPLIFVNSQRLFSGKKTRALTKALERQRVDDLKTIRRYIASYLDRNLVAHAISLLRMYKEIESCLSVQEVVQRKILCSSKETIFSSLLGSKCSFLFDKATKDKTGSENSFMVLSSGEQLSHLFENDYCTVGEEFKKRIQNAVLEMELSRSKK